MSLAAVRNIGSPRALRSGEDVEDFEQEIVDQYALAMAAAGLSDGHVGNTRSVVIEFARSLAGPLWSASCDHADRFLAEQRRAGRCVSTRAGKAGALAVFFEFVISCYQGDIAALTGVVFGRPIDEFNRQSGASLGKVRVPPSETEVDELFAKWRVSVLEARTYLPAARDYFAASLRRRLGLRMNKTVMLDIRDWRPDLDGFAKLHVRHGKGSRGRGPKTRLVPAINGADRLIDWWLAEVRHRFGNDWSDPDAPMLPSERYGPEIERCQRVGDDALRQGLCSAAATWLPGWSGRLTPHVLRHYCASSLYGSGMDLKALQELLGHQWLATTSGYIHVRSDHIEKAWTAANRRLEVRRGDLAESVAQVRQTQVRTAPVIRPPARCNACQTTVPLPLDNQAIRRALDSPDPAIAFALALVAFHALTAKQLAWLQLTDIVDGRLALNWRDIPLAEPVRVRLTAWLDHRNRTSPASINPHLFVGRVSAPRLAPVGAALGKQFQWKGTDLRHRALREDRILQEIHATGGDVRQICDLFGVSIETAMRYALTLGHPDLERRTPDESASTCLDRLASKTID